MSEEMLITIVTVRKNKEQTKMEEQEPPFEMTWICPRCKTKNIDVPAWTCFPMCEQCINTWTWYEIDSQPKEGH